MILKLLIRLILAQMSQYLPRVMFRNFASAMLGFLVGSAYSEEASILEHATLGNEGLVNSYIGDNLLFDLNFKTPWTVKVESMGVQEEIVVILPTE